MSDKIKPAVDSIPMSVKPRNSRTKNLLICIVEASVRKAMKQVREKSPVLKEMISKGEVALVGGIYSVSTGEVIFFNK